MASDDFVRIIYRPKRDVHTPAASKGPTNSAKLRRNRTSVSIEPDLYKTFVTIVGDAVGARTRIRQWATDSDSLRTDASDNTGVSRLVHKQMLAVIRRVVEEGLTVIRQGGPTALQRVLSVDDKQEAASAPTPPPPARSAKASTRPAPTSHGLDDWDSFKAAPTSRPKTSSPDKRKVHALDPFAPVAIPTPDSLSDDEPSDLPPAAAMASAAAPQPALRP